MNEKDIKKLGEIVPEAARIELRRVLQAIIDQIDAEDAQASEAA